MKMRLATFALALAARLAHLLLLDEPLLFAHQHIYFWSGLRIAEAARPLDYVLRSDEWIGWGRGWTLAPLYQLFLGGAFLLDGSRLLPVQLLQCLMGALTAMLVGDLGRRISPRFGAWAGVVYAVYWPSVSFASQTMTENLHTTLLVASLATLARTADRPRPATFAAGGFLLGLSALARAVSTAFVPLAILWTLLVHGWRRGAKGAVALGIAAACAILPWTARNVFYRGDPLLIESVGMYNLWNDNAFVDEGRMARQEQKMFNPRTSPSQRRALAVQYAREGIANNLGSFGEKVWNNLRYLVRPDSLFGVLIGLLPPPSPWDVLSIPFGDALLLAGIPSFLVFAFCGARSPARFLTLFWFSYYLFLLVVVFHVETRYRSALMPFFFAGAAAGLEPLADAAQRRRLLVRGVFALGCAIVLLTLRPYALPAWHASRSAAAAARARSFVEKGDTATATRTIEEASVGELNPARPWLTHAAFLARTGRSAQAIEAFRRVEEVAAGHMLGPMLLTRLWLDVGNAEQAELASEEARRISFVHDAWIVLENAWRGLPPPKTDSLRLGWDDYGAVRGFLKPFRDFRWTLHRAELRLDPPWPERDLELTLEMGSPEPSPFERPQVRVRTCGGPARVFELTRGIRPYVWQASCPAGSPVHVELLSPTFNKSGEHDDQGVRVDRFSVRPARR